MKNTLKSHWPLVLFSSIYLILFFATAGRYGIFRDELYYIACARDLAWGYVDHPPFSLVILRLVLVTLGDSVLAIRTVAALSGVVCMIFTWNLTRNLGGDRFASSLAILAWFGNLMFLALTNFFSMNALDLVFWLAGFLVVTIWIRSQNPKGWIVLGLVVGLGLLNKYSMGFWAASFGIALLLSSHRNALLRPGPWLAAGIAAILFLPHIIWQIQHDWPSLEFIHNAATYKNVQMSPVELLLGVIVEMNPVNVLIWLPGLAALLFWPPLRRFRLFGFLALVFFIFMLLQNPKVYYLAPVFPVLYAAGSIWLSRILSNRWRFGRPVLVIMLVLMTLLVLPVAMPLLPPAMLVGYMEDIGLKPRAQENSAQSELPQHFADRFGWEEMAIMVSDYFTQLPDSVQQDIAVYTTNYGEAGAIDYYRKHYPLPPAISGHNNYYLWGPGNISGEHLLSIGSRREDLEKGYESVVLLGRFQAEWVMPYENDLPIYYCTGLKADFKQLWLTTRHFM